MRTQESISATDLEMMVAMASVNTKPPIEKTGWISVKGTKFRAGAIDKITLEKGYASTNHSSEPCVCMWLSQPDNRMSSFGMGNGTRVSAERFYLDEGWYAIEQLRREGIYSQDERNDAIRKYQDYLDAFKADMAKCS